MLYFVELLQYKVGGIDLFWLLGADADAHAAIALAEVFRDALDAVMPGAATTGAGAYLAKVDV